MREEHGPGETQKGERPTQGARETQPQREGKRNREYEGFKAQGLLEGHPPEKGTTRPTERGPQPRGPSTVG